MQKVEENWRPVAFASKSPAKKYSQIEKEALSSTWACEKFSPYIVGNEIPNRNGPQAFGPILWH